MATVDSNNQSHQALQVSEINLNAGENAVVDLSSERIAKVAWDDGGVSWTIAPQTDGDSFEVKVEHSLMPAGDDTKYWAEDVDSPFDQDAPVLQGNEHFRVQRIRFTATSGDVTIIVSSNSKFEVATA